MARAAAFTMLFMIPLAAASPFPAKSASYHVISTLASVGGPSSGLVADPQGRLYGVADAGGPRLDGMVFRLTRPSSGKGSWSIEVLHTFSGNDGSLPFAPVILGSAGEVYGTTSSGGARSQGTIFRLDNKPGWPITILHNFGYFPNDGTSGAALVFGPNGLLYGVTGGGGYNGQGALFAVSPQGSSTYYSIVNEPGRHGEDYSSVTPQGSKRLMTASYVGGANQAGAVLAFEQDATGHWHQRDLYDFSAVSGAVTGSYPLLVGKGVLRPALFACGRGGAHGDGGIYRLSPPAQRGAAWTQTVLYNFGDQAGDPSTSGGSSVFCNLTQNDSGTLFGNSSVGGAFGGGAVFELDPPAQPGGNWTETVLHSFRQHGPLGGQPLDTPVRFGSALYGASGPTLHDFGVAWELTP